MLFILIGVGIFGGYLVWRIFESANIFRDRSEPKKIRAGGVVLIPVILWYLMRSYMPYSASLAAAVAVAGVMGIVDDYRGLNGYVKAFITLLLSFLILWSVGWNLHIHSLYIDVYVPAFNSLFWVLFFIGFTNAFNVIDGADGVLLTTSLILLSYLYVLSGDFMFLAVAAVATGLLVWNSPPARLIMGDTGSYTLGVFITTSFLLLPDIPIESKLLALSLPLVDTLTTVVRRLSKGRSIFAGDREHIHHVLYRRLGDRWGLFSILIINSVSVALSYLYLMYGWPVLLVGLIWWSALVWVSFSPV